METLTLSVKGYNVNAITKALQRTRGVQGVDVDLMENVATITFDETEADAGVLREVVSGTRRQAEPSGS